MMAARRRPSPAPGINGQQCGRLAMLAAWLRAPRSMLASWTRSDLASGRDAASPQRGFLSAYWRIHSHSLCTADRGHSCLGRAPPLGRLMLFRTASVSLAQNSERLRP
jgi:hypothetical protein